VKKTIKYLLLFILIIPLSGCFKRDTMEDIKIYTTIYPIEYIMQRLYGNYSEIKSIYPNGVNIQLDKENINNNLYTLTEKQLSDYSKADLFVFNSLLYEGNYVEEMLKSNKDMKIINATDHLTEDEFYDLEEIWLNPSRLLTVARNIKNGLNEYVSNYYIKQDIENNFNTLKEELDKLDAKLVETCKNADNKIIVVSDDAFKFLSKDKYGLTVYSLEENDSLNSKTISDVKDLIKSGKIKYIYIKQHEDANDTIKNLIKDTDVELVEMHMLTNLTETERNNKKDYFSIMNENLDLLKKSLYN
jgi:zinc transport system substrate-binding protein